MHGLAYISGPITGVADFEQAFALEERRLIEEGWQVINPCHAFRGHDGVSQERFMRFHIHSILQVDAVVMLAGWQDSRGASFEYRMARVLGLPVLTRDAGGALVEHEAQ